MPDTMRDLEKLPPLMKQRGPVDFQAIHEWPTLVRSVAPEYPDVARQAEAEGKVIVLVTIDETGRVVNAEIDGSTAIGLLEQAALAAARKFIFKPAKQRDRPVTCQVLIPFTFSLR